MDLTRRELGLWLVYCGLVAALAGCCVGRPCAARYEHGRYDQKVESERRDALDEFHRCQVDLQDALRRAERAEQGRKVSGDARPYWFDELTKPKDSLQQ